MAASMADRAQGWFTGARERRPFLDHLVLTIEHYIATQGPANAGNITYFGFLSFFPLLALGFASVGVVSKVYPNARDALITALGDVFPGIIGEGESQISVSTFEGAVGTAGLIGVLGIVYAGLNWLSAMRSGFEHAFELPPQEVPNFVVGKLRDVMTLAAVGTVLIASVALSTTVTGFSQDVRRVLGLDQVPGTGLALSGLGILLGVATSTLLFVTLFKLLADPEVPFAALRSGALFSAIGFELLKLVASTLVRLATNNPAAAVFGIALVLVVWISYFARVSMLGASWAETSPITREWRAKEAEAAALAEAEQMLQVRWGPNAPEDEETVERPEEVITIIRSAVAFGAITLLLRRAYKD
jgi:membrane protein